MIPALRRQMPAYSPLDTRIVLAGLRGAVHEPARLREMVARQLRDAYGARDVLLVGGGTTALQLAIAGVRALAARGPVAVPAYCCYDVASAVEGADAKALLYDLDAHSLTPEPCSLHAALEREPSALVAVHLYGYPVDAECLVRLCRDAGAVLIEDAAQGSGASLRGRPLGSFGSLSVLSFGRGKGVTAGAGGAILAHDETGERVLQWAAGQLVAARAGVRDAALLAAQWLLARPAAYGLPASVPFLHLGQTVYHPPRASRRMSSVAVGALDAAVSAGGDEPVLRRRKAEWLLSRARESSRVSVIREADAGTPGYLRLPLRARDTTAERVARELGRFGVAAGYPQSLVSLQPFQLRIVNPRADVSGARDLAETLFTCPTHSRVQDTDLEALERWLSR